MAKENTYFVGDTPLLEVVFLDNDGNELTPTSANVQIIQDDETVFQSLTAAAISGNKVQYQVTTPLIAGNFKTYFTTTFNVQEFTQTIDFRVAVINGRAD